LVNSSVTASVIGKTVLEPSIVIVPLSAAAWLGAPLVPLVGADDAPPPEQALTTMATRASAAIGLSLGIVTGSILLVRSSGVLDGQLVPNLTPRRSLDWVNGPLVAR
jgi:hypothetical protein